MSIHRLASDLPGVVKLLEVFFDAEERTLYLVQELCEGGELFEMIARGDTYDEREAASVTRTVLAALAALHDRGVVHRDVKLENILLRTSASRTDVALADLGIARRVAPGGGDRPNSLAGSVHYLSPEVVSRRPYGAATDVWGLGVAVYALLAGRLPFVGATTAELFAAIARGDVDYANDEMRRVSDEGRAAVARMLAVDDAARPRARDLLEDAWLRGDGQGRNLEENIPQLRALVRWRATWRRSVNAVRAVNIFASPLAALRRPPAPTPAPSPSSPRPSPRSVRPGRGSPSPTTTSVPDNL